MPVSSPRHQEPATFLTQSLCRLISVVILAGGMVAASATSLGESWIWLCAPVILLAWLDLNAAPQTSERSTHGGALKVLPFYVLVFGVAFAFQEFGPPSVAKARSGTLAGCGSGGCGKAGGCGNGGCGAASGGGCSCSSGAKAASPSGPAAVHQTAQASAQAGQTRVGGRPTPPSIRPAKPTIQVELPPIAPRTPGSSLTTLVGQNSASTSAKPTQSPATSTMGTPQPKSSSAQSSSKSPSGNARAASEADVKK